MKKHLLSIVCLFSLLIGMVNAQNNPASQVVPGEWIKSWLLIGPFPLSESKDPLKIGDHLPGFDTDFLKAKGGESNLKIKDGDVVKYPKGSAKCFIYNSPDSVVNLDVAISRNAPVAGYAYTELDLSEPKMMFVSFGSREGGSLWVNGAKVWDYQPQRNLVPDNDMIPVNLKAGKNSVLFKVERRRTNWLFMARMLPFSAKALVKSGDVFKMTTNENGDAILASRFMPPVLQQLIRKVDLEVVSDQKKTVLKEQDKKDYPGKLNLDLSVFQPYKASMSITLNNGETTREELPFSAGKRSEYVLFSNGKTRYRIALDGNASESEKWAANELQHWLSEISGTYFPIQTLGQQRFRGSQIIIGFNDTVKAKTNAPAPAELDESFTYCNSGPDILIYGGKMRGSMYGVMSFLENEFGCRWYTPSVSVIPKRNEMKFNRYEHNEAPGIRVRNDFYFEAFDPVWAARNRMNGRMTYNPQPGGVEAYWSVHTFFALVPPREFYATHPEYYSLIDGKRVSDRAQLCLTNPDVLKIVIERIKKRMHESPEYLIYDVSQNDWRNPCQCDKCQAIVKQEGSESGPINWFVNQVAEAVEKEYPDKFIGTLAYQYTRKPPKNIRPRNNVVIRLCPIEACVAHTLDSCPQNKSFMDDLTGWASIAPHLYIWDYVVNFAHYIMPYPNINVLQSNIKTFQKNKAIGIMEQAAYQSRGGEFSELKSYLISRLLWNPDCNTEAVINDFMFGYYGRAGQYIRQYFDLLNSRVTPETHMHIRLAPEDKLFSDELVVESCQLFEKALKAAENEEIMHRVELAYLPMMYLKCKRTPVLAKYDGTYERFSNIAKREGITHYAEYGETIPSFNAGVENAK
jgi:hypothetical protein